MRTICYVDEEARDIDSFIFAMEPYFKVKDIHVQSSTEFTTLLDEILTEKFDYLIVDYYLNEYSAVGYTGDDVILEFSRRYKEFPVMLLTSDDKRAINMAEGIDVEIIHDKREYSEDVDTFVERVNKKIDKYNKDQATAEEELIALNQKAQDSELTAVEEQRRNELDSFLDESLGAAAKTVTLTEKETTNALRLTELIDKTDALIQKLSKDERV